MNRQVMARMIAATVESAIRRVPVPTWRPGTVVAVGTSRSCSVMVDGDTAPTTMHPGGLLVAAGDRVMVLFYPPRGVMVAARLGEAAGYALQMMTAAVDPADATTYYFGGISSLVPSTTGGERPIYIPRSGTIRVAYVTHAATVAGTAEAWPLSVRVNNTTSYLVESLSVSSQYRVWSNTALEIPVTQGDYVEIEAVSPTWATNPTGVAFGGTLLVA